MCSRKIHSNGGIPFVVESYSSLNHCGRVRRLPESTPAYASVRPRTPEYAPVRPSTPGYARVRPSTPGYARIRPSTPKYARVRLSKREYVRVSPRVPEQARVRLSSTSARTRPAHSAPFYDNSWLLHCTCHFCN